MADYKGLRGVTVLRTVADLEQHSYGREPSPVVAAPTPAPKKAKVEKEPDPEPSLDEMNYDELYEIAQEMDIDGCSEMKKSELLKAIKKTRKG